jgi:hypothetical protein
MARRQLPLCFSYALTGIAQSTKSDSTATAQQLRGHTVKMTTFFLRTPRRPVWLCCLLLGLLAASPSFAGVFGPDATPASTADDTARFYGTWKAVFFSNGQQVTILSAHDANGYRNFVVTPNGNVAADSGTFSAGNGRYQTSAPSPNNSGTYQFITSGTVKCTNAAGQSVTWWRQSKSTQVDATTAIPANSTPPAPTAAFMKK